jgi:hypothetical protein
MKLSQVHPYAGILMAVIVQTESSGATWFLGRPYNPGDIRVGVS